MKNNTSEIHRSVSVIIPNWNGVYLMKKHLQHVIDAAPNAEIIVTDDMSTDGSVEYLKKYFPSVVVIKRKVRGGFAANVNTGVAAARGDIIILINTDVEPEKDFLKPLLLRFADQQVFAVGCLEKSQEKGKIVLRGRGLAHWEKGYFIHARGEIDSTETAWVSGGSGAFRKTMWDKLGGMDTLYSPFYWEDIDLSYRARKAGWKILFEPKSVVHHYHEEGKIKSVYTTTDVKRIVYRNQFIFIWKNLTDKKQLLFHALYTPVRIIQAMLDGDYLMLQGFCLAIQKIKAILTCRYLQRRSYSMTDRDLDLWA